ncbi:APC family permease [Candidatus Woesearchaeota archaeon]|nr:APC family permease [Candidatus Woesearchaeota archaeon]MBW3005324.1 APC family permease [Candidatus Woesearchaeota archaeon]
MVRKTLSAIKHKISLFTLIMISSALVISVRNFPTEAETGMQMIFFALFAAIGFFIPVALVSAELATLLPKQGGIFAWVKAAFGDRFGFVSSWLQWTYMMIGSVPMLYFIAGSLAFVMMPALAHSKPFMALIVLLVTWAATIYNFRGLKASGKISTYGFLLGVLIPGVLIILFGIIYWVTGNPIQMNMSLTAKNIIPDLSKLTTLVLLVGFMRTFTGIEVSASHANEVKNPGRNYPLAILVVVVLALALNILGSLAVAIVVPQQQISLAAGLMEAFKVFFGQFHLAWLVPVLAILTAIGALGEITTWTLGPVKAVYASAKTGALPKFFNKENKKGIPVRLLIVQATVISLIGCGLLLMPKLNTAFWMANAMACCIYFFMYAMMILACLKLRYSMPKAKRAYKIPGGWFGIWLVSLVGLATLVFGFIIAFLPPAQLHVTDATAYLTITIGGITTLLIVPFIIFALRKVWQTR